MSSLTAKEAFQKLPQKLHNFFIKYPPRPFAQYATQPSTVSDPQLNPFLPNKNPENGRWHSPKYSLRRSADLFKMAYKFGVQELLPPMPQGKSFFEDKYENKNWMRGQLRQKKHKWERELDNKISTRKSALAAMDETIIKARPSFKKQLEKKQQRERTWY